jgi:aconitate hydratase
VIAKSFARIHRQNLINFGILPLKLAEPADYDALSQLDEVEIPGVAGALRDGTSSFTLLDKTAGMSVALTTDLSEREWEIVLAGGRLNFIKSRAG